MRSDPVVDAIYNWNAEQRSQGMQALPASTDPFEMARSGGSFDVRGESNQSAVEDGYQFTREARHGAIMSAPGGSIDNLESFLYGPSTTSKSFAAEMFAGVYLARNYGVDPSDVLESRVGLDKKLFPSEWIKPLPADLPLPYFNIGLMRNENELAASRETQYTPVLAQLRDVDMPVTAWKWSHLNKDNIETIGYLRMSPYGAEDVGTRLYELDSRGDERVFSVMPPPSAFNQNFSGLSPKELALVGDTFAYMPENAKLTKEQADNVLNEINKFTRSNKTSLEDRAALLSTHMSVTSRANVNGLRGAEPTVELFQYALMSHAGNGRQLPLAKVSSNRMLPTTTSEFVPFFSINKKAPMAQAIENAFKLTPSKSMQSIAAKTPEVEALPNQLKGLIPGQPLPDKFEIVVFGSTNKPGNFILRPGIDDKPIGGVNSPGKSVSIGTNLEIQTEFKKCLVQDEK